MATGSDAFLDHLLFQVALSGEQGLGIKALSEAFINYNVRTQDEQADEDDADVDDGDVDLLFSLKPPGAKSEAQSQTSDPQHLERIWTWLVDHPDISVHQDESQDETAFDETSPLTPVLKAHAHEKLRTTENRIWHALTDHDVDWRRIPKLEFQCLQVIAAQGPQGILQPDVTKLTGQDKRSVPKRTASLATKGYITKELCLGGGIKTSLLRLKKLTQQAQNSTYIELTTNAGKGEEGSTRRMVHYENWYNEVITHLKKHDNLMAYEDLRKEMGIHGLKWETRALHRCMRRLDKAGCIQRLKARQDVENAPEDLQAQSKDGDPEDELPSKPQKKSKVRWARCIKLMREPTEKDKEAFTSTAGFVDNDKTLDDQDDSDLDADVDDEFPEADEDVTILDGANKMPEAKQRIPAQWQPSLHHTQFMFHIIHSSGTKGVSTMELADCGMGHFWRRPLDELLGRLTDVWTTSQPLHLRHLAIVRDTAFLSRTSHYMFRSYENFKKLVDNGEAVWEAIGIDPSEIEKEPVLDAWGFPEVKAANMLGPEGIANLSHCKNTVTKLRTRIKKNIFDTKHADGFAPRVYRNTFVTNLTPGKRDSEVAAVHAAPAQSAPTQAILAEPQSPQLEDNSPMATPRTTKQYKKDLWKMNPKRVEAELKEWKLRARRTAESKARAELGYNPKRPTGAENSKPNKRRKRKTADEAGDIAGAVAGFVNATESIPPPASDTGADDNNPPETPARESAEHSSNEVPISQPDTSADNEIGAKPTYEKRVSEIEQEILNKATPGVYINPPGSGQMKTSKFLPRGRPSKYLIAVFKTDKLRKLDWFTEDDDQYTPGMAQPGSLDDHVAGGLDDSVQSTPGQEIEQNDASAQSEPEDQIIIRNGRRGMKRKARNSLRLRVVKKLAVESSFEQPQSSPTHHAGTLEDDPLEAQQEDASEVPSLPLESAISQATIDPTPESTTKSISGRETETLSGTAATTQEQNTFLGAEQRKLRPPKTPAKTQLSSIQQPARPPIIQESEQQVTSGAADSDVQMEDAPELLNETQELSVLTTPAPGAQETIKGDSMDTETPAKAQSPSTQRTAYPSILPTPGKQAKIPKKVGVGRSGGIVSFNREKIILELIHKHGGFFGGDRELFYPFVTAWEKTYGRRPDRHTLDRVLITLVADGRLKRMSFTFQAPNGSIPTKSIVMEPNIDENAPEVQELKQKIVAYYPMSYLPKDAELAPDLRKHVEADVRNIHAKRPPDVPTLKNYFPEDDSTFVSRLHKPHRVKLGMTEASLQSGSSARRRRREEEERRQERYLQAQLEEAQEVEEAQAALQTDFQLDSYQHDPDRAFVDRGPNGRHRLAKLQRWGAEEHIVPKRALGLLTANQQQTAEQNSMDAAAASTFGRLTMPKVRSAPSTSADGTQARPVGSSGPAGAFPNVAGTFMVVETLSLTSPYQPFHSQSGTFSTNPVVITTSSKPTQFGFGGERMPMSLADIFQQAGEEASLLEVPQMVQQEVPEQNAEAPRPGPPALRPLAALKPKHPLIMNTPRPRKPVDRPMPEYKPYNQRVAVPRATRTGIFSMSEKEEQRLIYAVVAVRTLTGGLEQHTNWGLVHQVFHYKFDPNYCRHRWSLMRSKHGGTADKLQMEFRTLFIEAYERGEVPGIDYVEPERYDWIAIVEWAEANLSSPSLSNELPDLPKDRKYLESRYSVRPTADLYNIAREDFWAAHVTHLRREELATHWTYAKPLTEGGKVSLHEEPLLLAKSWVRANVVTPDSSYDSNAAHNKLIKVESDLPKALEQLLGAKIIRMENKGRTIPGRNYDISDQVLTMFKRHWDATFLRSTAAYKTVIDSEFVKHGKIAVDYHATDPQMTAMTNLVSNGRAKVVPILPAVNHTIDAPWPRLTKWGFTEGNYKTVHMDKSRLHFGLELHPTSTYVAGHPLEPLDIPLTKQFPGEIGARLPLWTDINGDLITVYWDMVLMSTLWLLVFRPGLTASTMAKNAYKGKVWAWELEMFLNWAEGSGLARKIEVENGGETGWTTAEWWWLAFGEKMQRSTRE